MFDNAWNTLQSTWKDNPYTLIADIDCDHDDAVDLCDEYYHEYKEKQANKRQEENYKNNVGNSIDLNPIDEKTNPLRGGFALFYGNPDDLSPYEGRRNYETLMLVVEKQLAQPTCSIWNIDVCAPQTQKHIAELRLLSEEQLENIESKLEEQIDTYKKNMEKQVAKLDQVINEIKSNGGQLNERIENALTKLDQEFGKSPGKNIPEQLFHKYNLVRHQTEEAMEDALISNRYNFVRQLLQDIEIRSDDDES